MPHSNEHRHTAFFCDFQFSKRQRSELKSHFTEEVIAALEEQASYLKGFYDTDPPAGREQKKRLQALRQAFDACIHELAAIDDLSASVLHAHAWRARLPFRDLCKAIDVYRDAAIESINAMRVPKSGPDASKETHTAIAIGNVLRQFDIDLNDDRKGPFVIATAVVFEALGIHKADPRNNVIRALQVIENTTR